ncbi:MAG: hypothetical protein AAF363_01520 [Bacteroidota bacterium]
MKKLTLLIVLASVFFLAKPSFGQTSILYNDKFAIELPKNKINLSQGGSEDLSILINKGKKYVSKEIDFLTSTNIEGLGINFESQTTTENKNKVTVSADETVEPGNYMVVIYGRLGTTRKGVALSVTIE